MAVYGVDTYGADTYGLSLPPAYMCTPFTAASTDYGTITVSWAKPSGDIFRYRLISNRYGYPVNENDGTVIMDSIPFFGTTYKDVQVIPGSYHYYAIFVLVDEVNNIWVCGGRTACLAVQDFSSAWKMWNKTPEHFKTVPGTGGEIDGDQADLPYLAQFYNVLGWALDYVHTQYSSFVITANDPMTCSISNLYNMAGQLGLKFSPFLPAYTVRKAVSNWAHVCRERGTKLGMRNEITLRTGWDADITMGNNIMLTNDQSLLLSPVFETYAPQREYVVGELVWWGPSGVVVEVIDWVNGQWTGAGYWYKCIAPCNGFAPTGTAVANTYWSPILDQNDFVYQLINPRTGQYSTWEVMAPAQTSSFIGIGGYSQGIGVAAPNGNGYGWNALRAINVGGVAQNIRIRSLARSTSDVSQMPDPSFEAGYTLPSTEVVSIPEWIPEWWPQSLFRMPGYPGQRHCPGQYNNAAYWTFSNFSYERSTANAHTGIYGLALSPTVNNVAGVATAESPWVSVAPSTGVTGTIWVKAPALPTGPTVNLLPDPEFENGTGGFLAIPAEGLFPTTVTLSIAQSGVLPYESGEISPYALSVNSSDGSFSTSFVPTPNTAPGQLNGPVIAVAAGQSYLFSAEICCTKVQGIGINWLNAGGAIISTTAGANIAGSQTAYTALSISGTAPTGAVSAQFTSNWYYAGYIAHVFFGNAATSSVLKLLLGFADQNGTQTVTTGPALTLTAGTWKQCTITGNSLSTSAYAWVGIQQTVLATGNTIYIDDVAVSDGVSFPDIPDPSVVLADGIDVPWVRPSQAWNATTRYVTNDRVLYQGQAFTALRASTGILPPVNCVANNEWAPLSENNRIRLCVSGYTSQNLSNSSTLQYAITPYVEWYDSNGVFITRLFARTPTTGGTPGKPNQLAFDSFTGPSKVVNQTPAGPVLGPWNATFYANEVLVGPPVFFRVDPFINFLYPFEHPAPSVAIAGWSATWTTEFTPPTTGVYTFGLTSAAGGARMIVNNTTVIDNWHAQSTSAQTGTVDLVAGVSVPVEVDYYVPAQPFTEVLEVSVCPVNDPSWFYFGANRFRTWTTEPFECYAGVPFQMQVGCAGDSSLGMVTWYTDGVPMGTTEIVMAGGRDRFGNILVEDVAVGTVQISETVPAGANFATIWIQEQGEVVSFNRFQYFRHYECETITTGINIPAPVPFTQTGTTQYTNSLAGRYTDDEQSTWSVPVGSFSVGAFAGGTAWPLTPTTRSIGLVTGPANTNLGITIRSLPATGYTAGIVFRYSNNTTYFRCGMQTLSLNNGGTWTTLATHSTPFSVNDRMTIILNGSAITVQRNGVTVSTATSTVNTSATLHGIVNEVT